MAAVSTQVYIRDYDYIEISFIHKRGKFRGKDIITAWFKQFRVKLLVLPLFFLIEFYLKRAKEIKYNN